MHIGTNYELYPGYFPAVTIASPAGLLQTAGINRITAFKKLVRNPESEIIPADSILTWKTTTQ